MFKGHLGEALLQAAQRHADRPALWVENTHYSYGQLLDQAARLALALQDGGVAPGDRVGILANRTLTNYAAIMAALLAGCAYVPMSSDSRPERNNSILRTADAKALIVDAHCAGRLGDLVTQLDPEILLISPDAEAPRPRLERCVTAADLGPPRLERLAVGDGLRADLLAYLMFTSGTTGAPKGVPITSANVAAFVEGVSRIGQMTCEDRVQQFTELAFDFSVHDLFTAWLHGAELFSVPANLRPLLVRFMAKHAITSTSMVPSAAAWAIDSRLLKPGGLPALRHTFFCGEALPTPVAARWQEGAPNGRLINLYGPTEATVALTAYEFDPQHAQELSVVPIGRAFPGQSVELFDPELNPVAQGETGQMLLSGSQVMAGYWKAPQINAEKMAQIDGRWWYKTGDLARVQEPYGLVFAGRADRQVKIKTYLVELQDIEATLRRVVGRQEVAVLAWPRTSSTSASGSVAFVRGSPLDVEEVRAGCRAITEDHMVPDKVFFVAELPQNVNGKVDYKQLESHPLLTG